MKWHQSEVENEEEFGITNVIRCWRFRCFRRSGPASSVWGSMSSTTCRFLSDAVNSQKRQLNVAIVPFSLLLILLLSARHRWKIRCSVLFYLFVLFCFTYNTRLLDFGSLPMPWITNLSFYYRLFFFNCRFFSRLESLDLWSTPNLTCKFAIQLRS